jgi:hypothetical protein
VTSVELIDGNLDFPFHKGPLPHEQEATNRWTKLLSGFRRLRVLESERNRHRVHRALLATLFEAQPFWPKLDRLRLKVERRWDSEREHNRHFDLFDHVMGYNDQLLCTFLDNHRATLRDLTLCGMVGIGPPYNCNNSQTLGTTLEFIKANLPSLKRAYICIEHMPGDRLEGNLYITGSQRPPGIDWRARDRQLADASGLDKLARRLGVGRLRSECGTHTMFRYQFGDYVLGRPTDLTKRHPDEPCNYGWTYEIDEMM